MMGSKQIAVVLQKKFGRIGTVLIYAFLEWVLIFLLMISALLSYLTTKFAHYFGLHPPCLWCNRLDRVLGKEEPGFYRNLICDLHAREISCLGYCHAHKHLADVQGMCENCLLSFAEENNKHNKPSLCTYKELVVGLDDEENKKGENEDEDEGGFVDKKDEFFVNSNNESDLITGGMCSCCKTPLKRSRMLSQRLIGEDRVEEQKSNPNSRPNPKPVVHPNPKPVVDFDVGVDSDKEQTSREIRSVYYSAPICKSRDMAMAEDPEEGNLKWKSMGHIGYTELKNTSDSGSDISEGDGGLGFGGQDQGSQVELISHNLVQGLDQYVISAVNNPFLDPDLEMTVLESIVETHQNQNQNQNDLLEEFSQTILVGEDSGSVAMMSSYDSGKHQEVCALTEMELPQKTEQLVPSLSLEEIPTALYELVNREISPSEDYCIGESELENSIISDIDHSKVLPAECLHYSKDIVQDSEVWSGTQVPKPVEEKESSSQTESGQASQHIEANERKDETNAMKVTVFRGEEANKPQQEVKLSPGFFHARELFRPDSQNSYSVVVGTSTTEDNRIPETPRFIEGLHMLHKRVSIDRNDSGFESFDGSILSEIEGESAVDRLKRQLELERKSLNNLYSELEAERNASAIAANQAMAMITRLQEEKAAMQMEALQYQRMMEEQAEYDQEALQLLNEVLVKREKEIKDLEMEVEMYRKRFRYEAIKERKDKRRKNSSEKAGTHLEIKRNLHNHLPNDQYEKGRSSSTSSLNEDTDESSSSSHEIGNIYLQQNNQSTPVGLTMNVNGVYEEEQLEDSFYESIVDLEEERLSILERLKTLEEKLHIFADDGESDIGKPRSENSDIVMVHPEENVEPQKYSDAMIEENRSSCLGTGDDASNGNGKSVKCQSVICNDLTDIHWKESQKRVNTGNVGPLAESMACTARMSTVVKGKKLLPLFEATSFEEESYDTEASHTTGQPNDWCTTSMIARDNTHLAIEEEVHDLNERLQALEADREFIRHSIKSLKKGDEGMKLLQEISQHLRELRKLDMKACSFNDSFAQENAVFVSSLERNGTITIQPNHCIS